MARTIARLSGKHVSAGGPSVRFCELHFHRLLPLLRDAGLAWCVSKAPCTIPRFHRLVRIFTETYP